MKLDNPISITLFSPNLTGGQRTITINKLDYTINDTPGKHICSIRIAMFPKPMILWQGDSYTSIGDYTQNQVEARIIELLGNDPASVLTSLLPSFAKKQNNV